MLQKKVKIFIIFFCIFVCFLQIQSKGIHRYYDEDPIFHVPLDQNNSITADWKVDYSTQTVSFEIHIRNEFKWFAFGFSDRGKHYLADYCVLWVDWKKNVNFQDTWSDETGLLSVDEQQDCLNFKFLKRGKTLKFMFTKKFDSCDNKDYIIEDGTVHIVWSLGYQKLFNLKGLNVSSNDIGMTRVQLLKTVEKDNPGYAEDIVVLDVLTKKVHIPSDETTYWCHVHKLPQDQFQNKYHIIQYESVIEEKNEGLVHHMEVFHCMAPENETISEYVGPCFSPERPNNTQVCKRVVAAWAMGAQPFKYPKEAGLPIGGPGYNPFIMLEIHYNNPERKKDVIDSSGMRFYLVSKLRQMDAGIIELGLEYTDKMAIPPGQKEFSLTGFCISDCTAVSIPPQGINVFASQLHTHLTGIRVFTRHVRDGRELPELNRDNHYSTHFQEIRRLKKIVKILPGDALITTCVYNTEKRSNITLGGFAISDEMCVNYIHYFPAINLEVCKSCISEQALTTYFDYMHNWENQKTRVDEDYSVSGNYKAIDWNPARIELLKDVYNEGPLSMQCNMSSGRRFPGYWENSPVTPILLPLPPPLRNCVF